MLCVFYIYGVFLLFEISPPPTKPPSSPHVGALCVCRSGKWEPDPTEGDVVRGGSMIWYGRSSANGCGVNDGIHRDTGVCDNKNNGGGFDPPRWASTRSSAHVPTLTSTWTSTRQPVRDPVFSRPATPTRAISARSSAAGFKGWIIRCLLHLIANASVSFIRRVWRVTAAAARARRTASK